MSSSTRRAGPYTQRQLDLLKFDGRLVFIASHLGETAEVNIRQIVRRRLRPVRFDHTAATAGL